MAIKIDFDAAHNPQPPTIVLAKKNGDKLGILNAKEIELTDSMNDKSEITFKVYKFIDGNKDCLWDEIVNFRLIYCVEWNQWFEITVETDETTETIKTVTCTELGCAELSQIMLYDIEINTEDDIARDDYKIPTILYNPEHPEASLLNRIIEKAPHYTIEHVDSTISKIQRTYSFDDVSIYDSFQDIADEINCLFVLSASSDNVDDVFLKSSNDKYLLDSGNEYLIVNNDYSARIKRTISVYDLDSTCVSCGYRGEYTDTCPKCGSHDINEGYGSDTTIFVTSDELAESINFSTDTDSIKNCFKLEADDDLMTATIKNCNPNGSDYIWYISDDAKRDMSKRLVKAIDAYDAEYKTRQTNYEYLNDKTDAVNQYNTLVDKYIGYNDALQKIKLPINGYSSLMNAYYDTIDFNLYLTSELMPTVKMDETSAEKEAAKLTVSNLSPVAVESIDNISLATANSVVLSMAKVVANSSKYRIKVHDGASLSGSKPSPTRTWTGRFDLTNYSDDENDTAISDEISIVINNDYETFIKQKIDKTLAKNDDGNKVGISELFDIDYSIDKFENEMKKYCLNRLISFHDACQSCIDILVEQGVTDNESWSKDIYNKLYKPYLERLRVIEDEMKVRQDEIYSIVGKYDDDGEIDEYGLQNFIVEEKDKTQDVLNFRNYLLRYNNNSESLWLEFCSFRREDKYSNDNYSSEGLNNAELFEKANEFIEVANEEIYKSAELQHSISADLRNLLVIKKFNPLVDSFEIGNWLRIMIDDKLYKLRLIEYTIDYDDLDNIPVEFSDVVRANSTIKSVKEALDQASTMATSYCYVKKQAKQGEKSNSILTNWADNGLSVTNTKIVGGSDNQSQTWDSHGMLFRKFNTETNDYEPTQMRIINSTIAITDDGWKTTRSAIGEYYYQDATSGEIKKAYGVNAETIIGKLLLGEQLELNNASGTMRFNESGLYVEDDNNSISIDPDNNTPIFNIKNKKTDKNIMSIGSDGNLVITGNITASKITLLDGATVSSSNVTGLSDVALSGSYTDLKNKPDLAKVATSGSYSDLSDQPNLSTSAISGSYTDLKNKPNLATVATSGNYGDLTNKPSLAAVATSAKYTDLQGDKSDAGKLLYVNTDGSVTTLSISALKTLLGIS